MKESLRGETHVRGLNLPVGQMREQEWHNCTLVFNQHLSQRQSVLRDLINAEET